MKQSSKSFCESSFGIYLQFAYWYIENQPPGKPREHHLGKVLQGRSKKKNLISYYLTWKFCFLVSGFHNPNYLDMKKIISNVWLLNFKMSQLETFKLPEVLVFYIIYSFVNMDLKFCHLVDRFDHTKYPSKPI